MLIFYVQKVILIAEGRDILNTRKLLIVTVKQLLEKKKFDELTVQDILDASGISRGTFYRYFSDKYDVVNTYYKEYVTENILSKFDGTNHISITTEILNFIYENKSYFSNIAFVEGQNSFCEFLYDFSYLAYKTNCLHNSKQNELSEEQLFKLDLITFQQVYQFKKWVSEGCKTSPDDVCRWSQDLIPKEFLSY